MPTSNLEGPDRVNVVRALLRDCEAALGIQAPGTDTKLKRAERHIAELEAELRCARDAVATSFAKQVSAQMEALKSAADNTVLRARVHELEGRRAGGGLDPEMVRRLLQLCHPDKHADSMASRAATQFLLGMKR